MSRLPRCAGPDHVKHACTDRSYQFTAARNLRTCPAAVRLYPPVTSAECTIECCLEDILLWSASQPRLCRHRPVALGDSPWCKFSNRARATNYVDSMCDAFSEAEVCMNMSVIIQDPRVHVIPSSTNIWLLHGLERTSSSMICVQDAEPYPLLHLLNSYVHQRPSTVQNHVSDGVPCVLHSPALNATFLDCRLQLVSNLPLLLHCVHLACFAKQAQ